MSGSISFIPFPESVFAGATAVNVFAVFCTVALISVAVRVSWLGIRWYITKDGEDLKPQEYVFFNTQLGNYAVCLLLAMGFITGAGIMALPWLINRGITLGTACTVQAFMNQVGTWSSGWFTVAIAVHTFNSLVMKRKQSLLLSRSIMAVGWSLSSVMAALPFFLPKSDGDIYGADGLMCGIKDIYPNFRFFLHLLPILVASVLSAVLYSIIFLALRGTLKIKGGIRLTLNPNERWSTNAEDVHYHKFVARVARSMIWYPVAYVALLVPYSILRLLMISGYSVPFEAVVFACTCWFMLGVVNVGLLYNTFRVLGPAFDARSQGSQSTRRDLESWGPSALLEKPFYDAGAVRQSTRAPLERKLSKTRPFHLPMASYERALLSSSSGSQETPLASNGASNFSSYGATAFGQQILSSPQRSMDKAEALAHSHSPKSSISESYYPYPRHVRSPSFATSPQSAAARIERHQTTSSIDSTNSRNPFRPIHERAESSASNEDLQTRYYGSASPTPSSSSGGSGRLPPRQLTLLASRTSPVPSRTGTPRPSNDDEASMWSNPRSPPSPPTAISRLR